MNADPKFLTEMDTYHYFAIGGGVLLLLAIILYFIPASRVRIPAVIAGVVGGLVAGLGLGVIFTVWSGYSLKPVPQQQPGVPPPGQGPGAVAMGGPGGPSMKPGGAGAAMKPGGAGGGGGGRAGGGQRPAPTAKVRLLGLVNKMNQLMGKPISLDLNEEQRKVVADQLKDIAAKDELSEEEAKARLDAILKALDNQRVVLESVGYSWTGAPLTFVGPPTPQPNPFKDVPFNDNLKSVLEKVEKSK